MEAIGSSRKACTWKSPALEAITGPEAVAGPNLDKQSLNLDSTLLEADAATLEEVAALEAAAWPWKNSRPVEVSLTVTGRHWPQGSVIAHPVWPVATRPGSATSPEGTGSGTTTVSVH